MSFEKPQDWGISYKDAKVVDDTDDFGRQVEMDLRPPASNVVQLDSLPRNEDPEGMWQQYVSNNFKIPDEIRGLRLLQLNAFVQNNTQISDEQKEVLASQIQEIRLAENIDNIEDRRYG